MKVSAECIPCLLERGYREALRVTCDPEKLMKTMTEILKVICKNFSPQVAPAYLGTLRDRVIKRILSEDPYRDLKKMANKFALQLLPKFKEEVFEDIKNYYKCFKKACTVAVAANAIEFDVLGYDFKLEEIQRTMEDSSLVLELDDTLQTYDHLKKSKKVLILTDNAGEIVFDCLLAECLKFMGLKVTVAVKDKPVLNDATLEDAYETGINKVVDELKTIGSDTVGLIWEESSKEIRQTFLDSDLVVAKGMGNYESLTELRNLGVYVLFLLKAKCNPVARSIGVKKGSNVALLRKL